MAVLFFVLAALACTAHCKPSGDPGVVLKKNSEASANAGDHESKLSPPWIKEMEGYEEEINQALEALWPFINFFINAFVINEQDKQKISTDLLDAFQHALDEMRKCLDQMMAKTVDQVNTQALEPVFTAVGDNLNRITKAVNDLTAPTSKKY